MRCPALSNCTNPAAFRVRSPDFRGLERGGTGNGGRRLQSRQRTKSQKGGWTRCSVRNMDRNEARRSLLPRKDRAPSSQYSLQKPERAKDWTDIVLRLTSLALEDMQHINGGRELVLFSQDFCIMPVSLPPLEHSRQSRHRSRDRRQLADVNHLSYWIYNVKAIVSMADLYQAVPFDVMDRGTRAPI